MESSFDIIEKFNPPFKNTEDCVYNTQYLKHTELIDSIIYSSFEFVRIYEISMSSTRSLKGIDYYNYYFISGNHRYHIATCKVKLDKPLLDKIVHNKMLEILKDELNVSNSKKIPF